MIVHMYDNGIPRISFYHRSREHVVDSVNLPLIAIRAGQSFAALVCQIKIRDLWALAHLISKVYSLVVGTSDTSKSFERANTLGSMVAVGSLDCDEPFWSSEVQQHSTYFPVFSLLTSEIKEQDKKRKLTIPRITVSVRIATSI